MTVLVAGNAALFDLVLASGARPAPSEVGILAASPGSSGIWSPGGTAPTIALTLAHLLRSTGHDVALWHPLPRTPDCIEIRDALAGAAVDLSRSPPSDHPPGRCVLLHDDCGRLAWSTPGDESALPASDVLEGVTHLVFAPVWGAWADALAEAAARRGIRISLVGAIPDEAARHDWSLVVVDAQQWETGPTLRTRLAAVTRGDAGLTLCLDGEKIEVPAEPCRVVDTTGAGDTLAGALIGAIIAGRTPQEAAVEAVGLAARCCEGWGAWAAFLRPVAATSPPDRSERVQGALSGLACGDAFGMPNSFLQAPPWRTAMMPGPAESPYHAGYEAGRITDDTEQALALTASLEEGLTIESAARHLLAWFEAVGGRTSLAVGPSTMRAMIAFDAGVPATETGTTGVTNGAAMRIAPIGIYAALAGLDETALVKVVAAACWPTHATGVAISGASAIAAAIAAAIEGRTWDEVMQRALSAAERGAREGRWIYAADCTERIRLGRRLIANAGTASAAATTISGIIGAGEATTESVAAALAIADWARGDPAVAIRLAGNLRGDTDTVAAMAGAICGAFAGIHAIPAAWQALVGRVNALDVEAWGLRLERCAAAQRP